MIDFNFTTTKNIEKFILPIFLVIFNFILKIWYLSYGEIAGDEPFTIFYAQVDFTTLFEMLPSENNPPLFILLTHYWIKVFGISAFSTRFLPLIFSSITVLFIYKLGRKFFNINIALLTSLLFTFSNYHILFAHETRAYSLFALLTVISIYAFLSLIKDKGSRKYFMVFVLANTLLIYNHFFGFFVLMIEGVSLVFIKEIRQNVFKKMVYSFLLTIVLYIPYIKLITERFLNSSGGTWVDTPNIKSLYYNLWKFSNAPFNTVLFIGFLLAAFIFYIIRSRRSRQGINPNTKVILTWFLLPYILMFVLSFSIPMFLDRYLVFISIGYYFSIAIVVNYLIKSKKILAITSMVLVLLMIYTCKPKSCNKGYNKELASVIKQNKTSQTLVYICPNWMDLGIVYYYNLDYFRDYKYMLERLNSDNVYPISNESGVNNYQLNQFNHIIYVQGWYQLVDPQNLIYNKIKNNYSIEFSDDSFEGHIIHHFSKDAIENSNLE